MTASLSVRYVKLYRLALLTETKCHVCTSKASCFAKKFTCLNGPERGVTMYTVSVENISNTRLRSALYNRCREDSVVVLPEAEAEVSSLV